MQFSGEFRLRHNLQCAGKNLSPGNYSLALRLDGKICRVTLNQNGNKIEIAGVVRIEGRNRARNVLFVERHRKTQAAGDQVEDVGLILSGNPEVEQTSDAGALAELIDDWFLVT